MLEYIDFDLQAIPDCPNWVLVVPKSVNLDSEFKARASQIIKASNQECRIYCGAGLAQMPFAAISKSLISFCFDQTNSPTHLRGTFRVKCILESPLLVNQSLLGIEELKGLSSFKKLLEAINNKVSAYEIFAEANWKMSYGLNKRLHVPRKINRDILTKNDPFSLNQKLSIITRTIGSRGQKLLRCVKSVAEFSKGLHSLDVEHIVIYSGDKPGLPDNAIVKFVKNEKTEHNSRISGLLKGIDASQGDYILFLDDDDFLNHDSAEELQQVLNFDPVQRIVFFDSQQIVENKRKNNGRAPKGHRYRALNSVASFLGPNRTPICSVVYPKSTLDHIAESLRGSGAPMVLEDHLIFMLALKVSDFNFVCSDKILTWISVHGDNQTVLNQIPIEWLSSMAAIRTTLLEDSNPKLTEIQARYANQLRFQEIQKGIPRKLLRLGTCSFWRAFLAFRVPGRLLSNQVTIRETWLKFLGH